MRVTAFMFLPALFLIGCASTYQEATESELAGAARLLAPLPPEGGSSTAAYDGDGSLESYVATALRQNPSLRASFERWRAAVHTIPQARRLPEPTVTYSAFVRHVETRVGPQRHRVGLRMTFPWPTKIIAGADAASIAARSSQRRFEAHALDLGARVAEVYWQLWLLDRTSSVQRDQLEVLRALSEATGTAVVVSRATLADLSQVDLAVSRLEDAVAAAEEQRLALSAELLATIGTTPGATTPIRPRSIPSGGLPGPTLADLVDAATAHPEVLAFSLGAQSFLSRARQARAEQAPGLSLGVDWIETGGQDPVILMVGLRLPLWRGAYRAAEQQAQSQSASLRAQALNASNHAQAQVVQAFASLRDAHRRIALYRGTLIAQAEATYGSVVGAYQSGEASAAATLLAQRELLDLELGLVRAQAQHAVAWAQLEGLVGGHIEPEADVR